MIVAPGGSGKTALATGMALSLVTGRDFMGSKVCGGPKKVWIWNLEDSIEELSRGLQAAASYWSISADDLNGNLFLNSALSGDHLKLVSNRNGGLKEDFELAKAIITELKSNAIDVLFIDPFVSSHDANENDNKSMDAVVKLLATIAYEANCSIVLLHHTNKAFGQVNENSARGASSVVNAARSVVTINPLNNDDAKLYDIDEDEMASYIKLHDC
jgi:RecA-family ATPase